MANAVLNQIAGALVASATSAPSGPTDAELLDRFRQNRDGTAFAALVRRHGRAVLSACRQVLANPADVDDAFQATFLVLVRKADAIEGATLGSWLYAVAHRLAVRARSDARRRAERESAAARRRTEATPPEPPWREAVAVLHEELDRLPGAYRRVLLLCYLRGLSREEAAAELGRSAGAVKGQLERGRKMLADRLARRGIGLSAGLLAVVTGNSAGAGGPPSGLIELTVRAVTGTPSPAAAALVRGALPMTNVTKSALASAVVGLVALVGFGLWLASSATDAEPGRPDPVAARAPASLEGRWLCVATQTDGKPSPTELWSRPATFTITGDTISAPHLFDGDASFSLPETPANAIDVRFKSVDGGAGVIRGIYSLQSDALKLRLPLDTSERSRPAGFETRPGDGTSVFVLERLKPGEVRPETVNEQLGAILWEARHEKQAAGSEQLAARCLKLAESHPGTQQAIVALLWTLANAPDGPSGKAALALLKGGGIAEADLDTLAMCTGIYSGSIGPGYFPDRVARELAPLLLARVRSAPDHPKAAAVLSSVCIYTRREDAPEVPPAFDEAARMIAERWTASPDITHFLEALTAVRQRPWAARYEPTVRSILARTPSGYLRNRAAFTLAKLVAETGEARQEEARELYVRLVNGYQPAAVDPAWASITEDIVEEARREIDGLLVRGVGGPAPKIEGVDLDGKPMALSEFRGKVVLLSFWASWCGPCMKLIPHERTLHDRYKDRPFALVGVNGDDIEKLDRKLLETHKITWRSFQNDRPNLKPISREWNLIGWPELYLVDHTGKIRRHWVGAPPRDELDREIDRWVAAAEGKPPAPGPAENMGVPKPDKGVPAKFLDKAYTDERGGESRYVVCVPDGHDAKAPLPVVLFLHGSGQVGTDNEEQLGIGLAPAIRKNGMPFLFVGIFPQSRDGSWLANSADGERALAILSEVERAFATDPRRVYLTGVSMGGEGVWSLAAAHPKRFAAIVPVCGGGNPRHAAALKDTPCWAFHGDSDRVVPAGATRDVVRAITAAGGRPLYQEYRGVDHNCWDRVYADADLYLWLRGQVSK